ncbi:hypothetical protein M1615_04650 [Patescibacteria group bacterium]|nr:hypothetical protein [Patescibacteria group bacterium]MCL5010194.1 hypothetical protein [Patescibacteria group bacterium]
MKTAQMGSAQKFTEIQDILEDVAILSGGNACLVMEIQSANFALLSQEEQAAKIAGYANLLNSLSFPVQILIRNKKTNIASYISLLNQEEQKSSFHKELSIEQNQKIKEQIRLYKEFVQNLIQDNAVLEKNFYLILSFSSLEKGIMGIGSNFADAARASLHTKAESVMTQIAKLGTRAKVLNREELIKLFYEVFNQDATRESSQEKSPIVVKGNTK